MILSNVQFVSSNNPFYAIYGLSLNLRRSSTGDYWFRPPHHSRETRSTLSTCQATIMGRRLRNFRIRLPDRDGRFESDAT